MSQENKTPHNFCETPEEKCTMNYCDENGCQNRKRHLVSKNQQLPTAEEILKQEVLKVTNGMEYEHNVTHKGILKAMEEHTRLHTSPLQARIAELEKKNDHLSNWKESAMKTFSDLNLQECGKLLNIGLGQSLAINLVPKIKELKAENDKLHDSVKSINYENSKLILERDGLKAENERLKNTPTNIETLLSEDNQRLNSENQKLREALEWYADSSNYIHSETEINKCFAFKMEKKAKEALKGQDNE